MGKMKKLEYLTLKNLFVNMVTQRIITIKKVCLIGFIPKMIEMMVERAAKISDENCFARAFCTTS